MAERSIAVADEQPDSGTVIDPATIGDNDVLVLRALGLGDTLTGVAALRALHRTLGGTRRLVLAISPDLGRWIAGFGVVDAVCATHELHPLPAMAGGHVAIDLHGNGSASRQVLQDSGARTVHGFAIPGTAASGPSWHPGEHEVLRWCRLVAALGAEPRMDDLRLRARPAAPIQQARSSPIAPVVIHPGAAFGSRRWGVRRWIAVGRHLIRDGHRIVVTGGPGERGLCSDLCDGLGSGAVNLGGRLSLSQLTALVSDARLVLSADTGIAHLATALATPSVTLFGPTPPTEWGPVIDPDLHTVLWTGKSGDRGDPHGPFIDPHLDAIGCDAILTAAHHHLTLSAATSSAADRHAYPTSRETS